MQTKQAIQTSANVIRITNIQAGDVYKRFDKDYDDRVYFGLVQAVHNDGVNTVIEAIEYRSSYYTLDANYRILRGETEYILFPSSPEELTMEFEEVKQRKIKEIEEAQQKISQNMKLVVEIDGLISGETQKKLRAMDYKELSQTDFDQRKALI